MWTVQINNTDGSVASVTAINGSFTWNATIKVKDLDTFANTAKEHFAKYQELHKDDDALKTNLETLLNK